MSGQCKYATFKPIGPDCDQMTMDAVGTVVLAEDSELRVARVFGSCQLHVVQLQLCSSFIAVRCCNQHSIFFVAVRCRPCAAPSLRIASLHGGSLMTVTCMSLHTPSALLATINTSMCSITDRAACCVPAPSCRDHQHLRQSAWW